MAILQTTLAMEFQNEAVVTGELDPLARETSLNADQELESWNAPEYIRIAALLSPLVKQKPALSSRFAETFGLRPLELASQAVPPCLQDRTQIDPGAALSAQLSLKLRRLFRMAYLDPDLLLLLLAQQDGCLQSFEGFPKQFQDHIAAETQQVFVPIAEMCGLWKYRRRWLDQVAWLLNPEECGKIANALSENRPVLTNTFEHLKRELGEKAGREEINCDILQIETHVGTIRYRSKTGGSVDDLVARLPVRILCNTKMDCYRMLGLAHSLGDRVGARFSKRMEDYIAAPQSNGYSALHTAILFRGSKELQSETLVELRVLTYDMHELNELGLAHHRFVRHADNDSQAWWSSLENQSSELRNRWNFTAGLGTFLSRFDLDTQSDPVYVFTPRGEIQFLPSRSTPLDFAYHVHTQLGHHAANVWVNGTTMPYHFPLKNGDIIRVDYDPRYPGPELSWLNFVATPYARAKIRRGLAERWKSIHSGRAHFAELVLKIIRTYERKTGYTFRLAENRLDAFLFRMVKARGLRDLSELYEMVELGRLTPDKLAYRFIAEELASAIVQSDGSPLEFPLFRIFFCQRCQPSPGRPIVAVPRRIGKSTRGLTIHVRGSVDCPGWPSSAPQIELRWSESKADKCGAEIRVTGLDRYHLLGDILEELYAEPGVYVNQANAQAQPDGIAEILLTMELNSWEQLAHLHKKISAIQRVLQVQSFPLPGGRPTLFETQQLGRLSNPYMQQEVHDRRIFFDRDEPIRILMKWLETPRPTHWFVLHGQRRVGKTSLANHLALEILPGRPFLPVYVDLQGLGGGTSEQVLGYIGGKVRKAFEHVRNKTLAVQPYIKDASAAFALSDLLERVSSEIKGDQLFIILDEFDILLDRTQRKEMDPLVLKNLNAVMRERREIHFLLIIQEGFYRDPRTWNSAADLIQKAQEHLLLPLDQSSASNLIVRPSGQLGLRFEDSVVDEIQLLSAGNPFFIHLLCWHLVERVRDQDRDLITHSDLKWVVDAVLGDGDRHFNHFLQSPTFRGIGRIVLSYVATQVPIYTWAPLSPMLSELVQFTGKRIDRRSLNNAVKSLDRNSILEVKREGKSLKVRIPVGLFHRWVRLNTDPATAIEEWWEMKERR